MEQIEKNKEFVTGLRALADWYELNPSIALPNKQITVASFPSGENLDTVKEIARALGTFDKETGDLFSLKKGFGGITLKFLFYRHTVCTKRVVGTKMVRKMKPSMSTPMVEVEEEEEIVEWDCPPLLT